MNIDYEKIYLTYDDVLLVPQHSNVYSRSDVDLTSGMLKLTLPIISANMDTVTEENMAIAMARCGGAGIIHRFLDSVRLGQIISRCKSGGANPIISIGVESDSDALLEVALNKGVTHFCIDVAHGDHGRVIELIKKIKNITLNSATIIAGNVATKGGALRLANAGADIVKIGIGNGANCTTRLVTGHGVPQLSAIIDIRNWLDFNKFENVEIIADGGIRNSGDIAKALAAGASYVMLGRYLAGTDESPGDAFNFKGNKVKLYRGMASFSAQRDRGKTRTPEGISGKVPAIGSVSTVLEALRGGLCSALSYSGARTLSELRERAQFIRVTQNSCVENGTRE